MGSKGGIVRMWDMNLVRNWAVTMNTQDNADMQKLIITILYSGKMVVIKSQKSAELWDTMTWKVVRHIDYKSGVRIAFSPDKN